MQLRLQHRPDALDQLQVVRPPAARRRSPADGAAPPPAPGRSPRPRRSAAAATPPALGPRRRPLAGDPRHRVAQPLGQRHRGVGLERPRRAVERASARPAAPTANRPFCGPGRGTSPRGERVEDRRRSSPPSGPRSNPCRSAPSARWRRRRGTRPPPRRTCRPPRARARCGAILPRQTAISSSAPQIMQDVVPQTCTCATLPDRLQLEHEVEGRDLEHPDVGHAQHPRDLLDRRPASPSPPAPAPARAAGSPRSPAGPRDTWRSAPSPIPGSRA